MKKISEILFCVMYFNLLVSCNIYNLSGRPGEGYIIEVMIGNPRQRFNILVDTGSTNLAIAGALHPNIDRYFLRENSSTVEDLDKKVSLLYTQGCWSGNLVSDIVYFPTLNWVPEIRCDIALITDSEGFYMNGSDWQGILGLGYPALARPSSSVKPWIDSLQRKSKDKTIAFSLTFCGPKNLGENSHHGSFEVLNNVLHPAFNGLQTASVVREWFYEIIMTNVSVNGIRVPVDCMSLNTDKAIVDSGTTNIYLPKEVFSEFIKIIIDETFKSNAVSVKKAHVAQKKMSKNRTAKDDNRPSTEPRVLDDGFWFKQVASCGKTPKRWDDMPTVSMELASSDSQFFRINLPGTSYIRQVFGNDTTQYCYKFSIEPAKTGSILGVVAMEGFQVVFNRTARTVGFVKSDCGPDVSIEGPFTYSKPEDDLGLFAKCTFEDGVTVSLLNIAAYVVCGVLLLAGFMFAYLFGQWLKNKYFKYHVSGTAVSISHASLINEEA